MHACKLLTPRYPEQNTDHCILPLDLSLVEALEVFCKAQRISMQVILLSAVNIVISKITAETAIFLNTVVHGRKKGEGMDVIGMQLIVFLCLLRSLPPTRCLTP